LQFRRVLFRSRPPGRPPRQPPPAPLTAARAQRGWCSAGALHPGLAARPGTPPPGNVEHQLDEIAPGNSPDEPVLVPPRQCPHTPAHPFRTATPPGTPGPREPRAPPRRPSPRATPRTSRCSSLPGNAPTLLPTRSEPPPPRERRASGNVEHQLDDRALWQLPGRASARPSQAMPPNPVRPETPPFWERRPLETSTPR